MEPYGNIKNKPFWLTKNLFEMSDQEWESLCDGCGKCCLEKAQEEDSGEVYTTCITCRLLNPETGKCSNYENRFKYVDDCIKLTPQKVEKISWLPKTCSYRLVHEGKDLPSWHPLKTKDPMSTITSGNGVNKFAIHPIYLDKDIDEIDISEYILDEEQI